MKTKSTLLIIILLILFTQCKQEQFDPWGVWNTEPAGEGMRIKTYSTGKYYEVPYDGLYIVKHCNEAIPPKKNKYPAIAISGDHIKLEKYEPIEDGFIFYLVSEGYKHTDKGPKFQDDTRIQVKMHFLDKDVCYFEYVSREDDNGFSLSELIRENIIYKRYRVKT